VADIKRISGYRLQFLEQKLRLFRGQKMVQDLQPLLHLVDLWKQEPFYLDDMLASQSPMNILSWGINSGELFVIVHDHAIIGTVKLSFIIPGRFAQMDVWGVPQIRQGYANNKIVAKTAHEIIDYAFKPFGEDGLGLMKLKANICVQNVPALKAARALRFKQFGVSPLDGFYGGQVYDIVQLELHNPVYFAPTIEDLPSGKPTHADTADVHSPTELHEPAESVLVDIEPDTASGDDEPAIGGREPADRDDGEPSPELDLAGAVRGKPFKPKRPSPIPSEL
jgi:RimJ/RimL family protein N-acetyltransferase